MLGEYLKFFKQDLKGKTLSDKTFWPRQRSSPTITLSLSNFMLNLWSRDMFRVELNGKFSNSLIRLVLSLPTKCTISAKVSINKTLNHWKLSILWPYNKLSEVEIHSSPPFSLTYLWNYSRNFLRKKRRTFNFQQKKKLKWHRHGEGWVVLLVELSWNSF